MPRPENAPPPIRTDPSNAFAHHTMRVRVPEIIQQTHDNNPDYAPAIKDALLALRDNIASGGPIPPLQELTPDRGDWLSQYSPHPGRGWHDTAWFFAEVYSYRLLLEAVDWWATGRDPFMPVKQAEEHSADLWEMVAGALDAAAAVPAVDERLSLLLHQALWGNRMDLSFRWALERGMDVSHDDLLVDDSAAVVRTLLDRRGEVHLVADNYGRELAMDLVLIDALLAAGCGPVTLHVKYHPTFVSDATLPDVTRFVDLMAVQDGATRALRKRLLNALWGGRLTILRHPFWNSTRYLWALPAELEVMLHRARLVIVKGDLNYRRVVGDAMWPGTVPFREVVGYFPAPLLCLRALKSDTMAGLSDDLMARLDVEDPDWRWNGKRGLLQSNV